ncbi:UNVERIFIED_CONTAM: hypothetical protein FKN15_065453 [Acipenser sinensis]
MADGDKAPLLDAPITPGHTFGPAVDDMLQRSHQAPESTKELERLMPKRPPPVHKQAQNWKPRFQQSQGPAPAKGVSTNPWLRKGGTSLSSTVKCTGKSLWLSLRQSSSPSNLLPQAQDPFSGSRLEYGVLNTV